MLRLTAHRLGPLCTCLVAGITGSNALAQTTAGTILASQRISATQGGFTGAPGSNDTFGHALVGIGDLNVDGVPDLAVGESRDDDAGTSAGAVWILFMNANGTVNSSVKITAGAAGFSGPLLPFDEFGSALAWLGDVDNDGFSDLAVGAWGDDDGGSGRGAVWILFMNPNGTVKGQQKISNTQGSFAAVLDNGDAFGISLGALGDRNADGTPDLVVGARFDDDGGLNRGAVYLVFLNQNGTAKNFQKISSTVGGFTGTLDNDDVFGSGVAGIGDINADGVLDVAVGAMQDDDGGSNNGAVYVLLLQPIGAINTVKTTQKIATNQGGFTGMLQSNQFGSTVGSIGDFDGDGVTDLGVGARLDAPGGIGGTAWLVLLRPNGTVKQAYPINDSTPGFGGVLGAGDEFGNTLSGIGDQDGDGILDIAVGAWLTDDATSEDGAVYVLHPGAACPDQVIQYGKGCPDAFGNTPRLFATSCPDAGTVANLGIDGAQGGASGVLLLGLNQAAIPIGAGGCSLWVSPVLPATIPLTLSGSGPGNGSITLFGPIPASVAGFSITMEVILSNSSVGQGFNTTNGIELGF